MSDQEMQFADPAWQPPHQRGVNTSSQQQDQYVPRPINVDTSEQPQWQPTPSPDEPYANASYMGYRAQSLSGTPLRPRQRGHRSPWLWIILALIILSLLGGAFSRVNSDGYAGYGMHDKGIYNGHPDFRPFNDVQHYQVGIHPTITIIDPNGSVHVHTGGPANEVAVQTDGYGKVPLDVKGGANDSLIINVDNGDANLDVTVANEADLVIKTSGNIDVSGVSGQMDLISDSGSITLSQVTLARNSAIKTSSGDVTFDGAFVPHGTYQFESDSGSVNVTLTPDTSYHLNVSTNGGSFNSNLPITTWPSNGGAQQLHTDVGKSPSATLILKTGTGSIDLNNNK